MRTTLTATYRSLQANLNRSGVRLQELRLMAASGRRINRPSDDPAAIAPMLQTQDRLRAAGRYQSTISTTLGRMDNLDSRLEQLENLMVQAKEIAIAAGNGSASASDRASYAQQIQLLREEVYHLANAQEDGKYLFAGYAQGSKPFPDADDPLTYAGDDGIIEMEIGPGEKVRTNLTGAELFQGAGGGVNLLAVLAELEQNITAGDASALSNQLDRLDQAADQVRSQRSLMGTLAQRVERAGDRMADYKDDMTALLSNYRDADLIETYSQLAQQEQAFSAALSVTGKISQLSILDYL